MTKKLSLLEQYQQELSRIDAEIQENSEKARECKRKINAIYETRSFEGNQLDAGQIEDKVQQLTNMKQGYENDASGLTTYDRHQVLYDISYTHDKIKQLKSKILNKQQQREDVEARKREYKEYVKRIAQCDSELNDIDYDLKQIEQELLETEGDN